MKTILITALGAVLAMPATAAPLGTLRGSWPATGTKEVRIEFPVGGLEVVGVTGNKVEAELSVRCKHGRRCEERAEKLQLVTDEKDGIRTLELKGHPKLDSDGLQVELRVSIPAALRLQIDMGVGDLDVRDVSGDVDVDLGVGDADVRVPERTAGRVECEVGVGDANVHSSGGNSRSSGILGRTVRWDGDEGGARVHLEVGVGDADVWLR